MKRVKKHAEKAIEYKTVRYLISGGTATAVDILSYFLCLHYILHKTDVDLTLFTVSSAIAALIFSYSCGFITSFTLSKFFVFTGSEMRTRHQLVRFTFVAIVTFFMNYFLMKVLMLFLGLYPTVARIVSAAVVAVLSYAMHNVYTFKVKGKNPRKSAGPQAKTNKSNKLDHTTNL